MNVTEPLIVPATDGLNVTATVQLAPAPSVPPHLA